jgi:hypothetical protein
MHNKRHTKRVNIMRLVLGRGLFEDDFEGAGNSLLGADGLTLGAPVTLNLGHQGEFVLHHYQAALITDGGAQAAAVTKS